MPTWVCVDRITGDLAVLEQEDRSMLRVPLGALPAGVREGDCLLVGETGYLPDPQETLRRREANRARLDALLAKNPPKQDK